MSGPETIPAYSDAELEAQYNNQRRVPEHPAILDDWVARTRALQAQAACDLDLAYGEGPRERLDLYRAGPATAPLLVYVHGGYWQRGDKSIYGAMARGPLARGMHVAVINYGLCPDAPFEGIAPQVARALAWLALEGPRRGVDPAHLVLAGHSAGGHLAACMRATDFTRLAASLPPCPLAGVLAISGLFQLAPLVPTSINAALGLDAALAARHSPLPLAPTPGACPVTAAVGGDESEEFRRQSRALAARWSQTIACDYLEVPGCNHFTVLEALADADGALCARAAAMGGLGAS